MDIPEIRCGEAQLKAPCHNVYLFNCQIKFFGVWENANFDSKKKKKIQGKHKKYIKIYNFNLKHVQ